MKVRIGNKVYDSNKEPVALILSSEDKANLNSIEPDCSKFCSFPDGMSVDEVQEWMRSPDVENV